MEKITIKSTSYRNHGMRYQARGRFHRPFDFRVLEKWITSTSHWIESYEWYLTRQFMAFGFDIGATQGHAGHKARQFTKSNRVAPGVIHQ